MSLKASYKSQPKKKLTQGELTRMHAIFEVFQRLNPNPKTELVYKDAYTLLIAVMLSAQTTDINVNKATLKLFALADTPRAMMDVPLDEIEQALQTLNFYRTKAKNVHAISRILMDTYGGDVPANRDALESLPGVGRKTANVVLNVAFHQPTLAVDTHIHRVGNRLGLCTTQTPTETEHALLRVIPPVFLYNAHHWLILHGRYICKARTPHCHICPIEQYCNFKDKK